MIGTARGARTPDPHIMAQADGIDTALPSEFLASALIELSRQSVLLYQLSYCRIFRKAKTLCMSLLTGHIYK